jgi:hypothetical protein
MVAAGVRTGSPLATREKILEPPSKSIAFRQHFPMLGYLQKILFICSIASCICPRSTPSCSFQALGLLFCEFLKHGTPSIHSRGRRAFIDMNQSVACADV